MRKPSPSRQALFDRVAVAGRDMTAQGVMYYTVIAGRFGLGVSDWRALDLLRRYGPMTAGQFATFTGLTPGGVTALVNRLAQAGAVRRQADAADGRKVIIEALAGAGEAEAIDAALQAALARLYANYTDDQLEAIGRFMRDVVDTVRDQTARLQARPLARKAGAAAKAGATRARRGPRNRG